VAKIDPRLLSKINSADEKANIKAIITLSRSEHDLEENTTTRDKLANDLVIHTENITHEKPRIVRHLPKLGVLLIEGNAKFLQKLIENEQVSSATISE
jgi:SPX domain protein involved in polyphosphate accumulation